MDQWIFGMWKNLLGRPSRSSTLGADRVAHRWKQALLDPQALSSSRNPQEKDTWQTPTEKNQVATEPQPFRPNC